VGSSLQVEAVLVHTIFRCVQEAPTNAILHAGAENIHLTIETRGETVTVTARDDGRGAAEVRAGHGLSGLRERIEGMGGKVEIEARPGSPRWPADALGAPRRLATSVVIEGIKLGARGFLLKDVSLEQLTEAIRIVAGKGTSTPPSPSGWSADWHVSPPASPLRPCPCR